MTHRPDLRQAKRRIAGRRLSFWRDVDDLAQVFVGLLRLQRNRIAGGSIPNRDEQVAVLRIDGDARTGLAHRSVGERCALKDGVRIRQRAGVLIQRGAVDSLDARVGIDDAHIDEEDSWVAGEVRIQRDVEETRLSAVVNRRQIRGDGMQGRTILVEDAEAAWLLRDEKTSTR